MLEYELFNFALNVCVFFFLVYIICNIEGAASFFQCSCLLIEVLTICMYVCVCTQVCVRVRSSLPWHAYLTASSWSSTSTDSSKKIKR